MVDFAAQLRNEQLLFHSQIAGNVEKKGMTSEVQFEQVLSGHLTELNGKYKIRITKTVYAPGGFIGDHHHSGPGVRMIQSGELTYVQPNKTTVYRQGDYFYESGDVSHTAYNRTHEPVVLLNFEILPADWKDASAIPVPRYPHDGRDERSSRRLSVMRRAKEENTTTAIRHDLQGTVAVQRFAARSTATA